MIIPIPWFQGSAIITQPNLDIEPPNYSLGVPTNTQTITQQIETKHDNSRKQKLTTFVSFTERESQQGHPQQPNTREPFKSPASTTVQCSVIITKDNGLKSNAIHTVLIETH